MEVSLADHSEVVCERLTVMLSELPGVEIIGQAQNVPESILTLVG